MQADTRRTDLTGLLPPELAGRNLIVFDGVCVFCSGFATMVARLDRADRFRFATAQSPLGEALFRRHGLPTEVYETNLVVTDGIGYTRMESLIATADALGWPWRALRLLKLLPEPRWALPWHLRQPARLWRLLAVNCRYCRLCRPMLPALPAAPKRSNELHVFSTSL